jgi:hypothetical protein
MDHRVKNVLLGGPSGAVDFQSAMARQTLDEAMGELPSEHRQVLKLAYFAGLTNREIASQLGLTVGGVRRLLRQGLAIIGAYIEHGRAAGRRAVHGFAGWLTFRNLDQVIQRSNGPSLDQLLQAGVVAAMTVATAAILITHHAAPAPVSHPHKASHTAAAGSSSHAIPVIKDPTLAEAVAPQVASAPVANVVHQATTVAPLPIKIQLPVRLPVRLPSALSL